MAEELLELDVDLERVADAGEELDGMERVATQLEEPILDAHAFEVKDLSQIAASDSSSSERGGTNARSSPGLASLGAGSAARSTLPLHVRGSASSCTKAEGIM